MAEFKGFMADPSHEDLNDHSPKAARQAFVKKFQAIDKAITAIKTYEEWDDELSKSLKKLSKEISEEVTASTSLVDVAVSKEDSATFDAISKITGFNFTEKEFNKYLGQYQNLVQSLKDDKGDDDPDEIDFDFDIDYELESVHSDIKVDYQYLVSLIQRYIDMGESASGYKQINDPAVDKYIASVKEKNPKLGEVISGVWLNLKANPSSFRGKKAFTVINERIDEIIEKKLTSFADEWCVALNDLEYAAKYYNNDYMELQTNFSEFKEKGGTLSKIRYNKIVREKSQELIVNEIIPLLQR